MIAFGSGQAERQKALKAAGAGASQEVDESESAQVQMELTVGLLRAQLLQREELKIKRENEVRRAGSPIGYFFLDPFARPSEKKGGAWMNGAIGRSRALAPPGSEVRLPVAILVCNQSEPTVDPTTGSVTPSLMTFNECTTLFHETGHGLQHMLTNVSEGNVSGISGVEWDAVEQPSQFMEYWVLEEATLSSMATHWQTGEPIPKELVSKIRAAKIESMVRMQLAINLNVISSTPSPSAFDRSSAFGRAPVAPPMTAAWGIPINDLITARGYGSLRPLPVADVD